MNSLMSEKKVICNDSIPNPIAPVPIPISIDHTDSKTVTILSGTIIKSSETNNKSKDKNTVNGNHHESDRIIKDKELKDENIMSTDISLSNESSLSPSEPMDCNSTPNASPAHANKFVNESNEDVAMSENSVSDLLKFSVFLLVTF